jgi:precorrin-6B methylase 2
VGDVELQRVRARSNGAVESSGGVDDERNSRQIECEALLQFAAKRLCAAQYEPHQATLAQRERSLSELRSQWRGLDRFARRLQAPDAGLADADRLAYGLRARELCERIRPLAAGIAAACCEVEQSRFGAVRERIRTGCYRWDDLLAELRRLPRHQRDAHVQMLLGVRSWWAELGCEADMVPYVPSALGPLLHIIDELSLGRSDTFCDLGSGLGMPTLLVGWATGAHAIGVELNATLVAQARHSAAQLGLGNVEFVHGDVRDFDYSRAKVFYLYLAFRGATLAAVVNKLDAEAKTRPVRVVALGANRELHSASWLEPERQGANQTCFSIFRSKPERLTASARPPRARG